MKKLLVLLMIVLMCGCSVTKEKQPSDCILNPYKSLISEENRQNLEIYYDADGIFDRYTISSLSEISLADISSENLIDRNGHTREEIADKYNGFYKTLNEKMAFIFNYEYESLDKMTVDENTIRIIIEVEDVRLYIYEGGNIKVVDNGVRTFYHTDGVSFNKDLESFYKTVDEMNEYNSKLITSNK